MADADPTTAGDEGSPKKKSKKPLLLGLALALGLGGGGFFAVFSGLILGADDEGGAAHAAAELAPLPDVAFVPVDPLVISLGPSSTARHLRFSAQLEVAAAHKSDVASVMPRVVDVLNGYLRAVEVTELEDPSALIRLRAQMLRRVQIVTGEGRVRDLLIMEFVLN